MNHELDYSLHEARERVCEQVLKADTLTEIEAAKQVLREWMKVHPDEQGMRDGFEQLYTIQEIIEAEEAKQGAGHPSKSFSANLREGQRILDQALDATDAAGDRGRNAGTPGVGAARSGGHWYSGGV